MPRYRSATAGPLLLALMAGACAGEPPRDDDPNRADAGPTALEADASDGASAPGTGPAPSPARGRPRSAPQGLEVPAVSTQPVLLAAAGPVVIIPDSIDFPTFQANQGVGT